MHAEQIMATLRLDQFALIFMTVRNPMDRLISEYRLRKMMLEAPETFSAWFERMLHGHAEDPHFLDNHIRPQVEFRVPGAETFHHEAGRAAIVQRIGAKLGINLAKPDITVEHQAPPTAIPSDDIARVEAMARVFYLRDYTAFGYLACDGHTRLGRK